MASSRVLHMQGITSKGISNTISETPSPTFQWALPLHSIYKLGKKTLSGNTIPALYYNTTQPRQVFLMPSNKHVLYRNLLLQTSVSRFHGLRKFFPPFYAVTQKTILMYRLYCVTFKSTLQKSQFPLRSTENRTVAPPRTSPTKLHFI